MEMRIQLMALGALIVLGLGIAYVGNIGNIRAPGQTGGVACTADAMQCPDGSWVGRSGPNCEFVCPEVTNTPPVSGGGGGGGGFAEYKSGIRGVVMLGPTCPVMREPPDPQCADRSYQTEVSVARAMNPGSPIAVMQSATDGTFRFSLAPGDYVVSAGGGKMLPRCSSVNVTVAPSGYVSADISCDTGIR